MLRLANSLKNIFYVFAFGNKFMFFRFITQIMTTGSLAPSERVAGVKIGVVFILPRRMQLNVVCVDGR